MATYKMTPIERRARVQALVKSRENRSLYNKYIKAKEAEEQQRLEAKRLEDEKNSQNFFVRGISTIGDIASNVITGAIKGLEGIYDMGASLVGAVGGIFDKDFAEGVKNHVAYDWTSENIGNPLQELTKYSYTKDGGIIEGVASGIGQMLPSVAVTVLTGGAGAPAAVSQAASLATLGVSAAGNATESAFNDGADYLQGLGYGIASGGVEVATEKLTGGLTKGLFGRGLLDGAKKSVADTGVRRIVKGALEEGAEEVLSELADPTLKAIYKGGSAFEEYKAPEYWKGVAEAGIVGGLTSLAYGGTVGKVINKAKGVNEDISDSIAQIETLEKKRNNLFSSDRLTEQSEQKISDSIAANYRNVEKALQKASENNREKYLKNYNLTEAFETDGTIKPDFAARLVSEVNLNTGKSNTTNGEVTMPLTSPDKRYYHPSLRGREQQITEQLAKQGTKVYSGELSETEQANYSKFKKAFHALSQKGLIQSDFVLAESTDRFYSYLDGKTVVIGKDALESDLWQKKIIHEIEHFTEGTKEWAEFASFVLNETDTTGAVQSVLSKGYGITQADAETLQSALTEGKLTDHHRLLLSEVMATQSEVLFGNEQMIERLANAKRGLAYKLLDRIKNFVKILKAKTPEEKAMIQKLERVQQLFEKALEKAGTNYAASQVDIENKIRYNRKRTPYSQYHTLAMQWAYASGTSIGDKKALYNAKDNTWNLIVADDSDEGYSVLRSIKDSPQNAGTIQNLFGEVYNEDNRGKQRTGALVRSNTQGYERTEGNGNVHNGTSRKQGANGRTRGVHQGEYQRNGNGDPRQGAGNNRVKPISYSFSDDGNNTVTYSDGKTTKFSLKDSEGRTLTEQQAEYFKNSKVRDDNGNLLVVYHGSPNRFFTFDRGRMGKGNDQFGAGFYFSTVRDHARNYGRNVHETYLNIKNPIVVNRTADGGDLFDVKITKKQAYEILKRHPLIYDSEDSPLGDMFEEYWNVGAKDYMIREAAQNLDSIGLLDSDYAAFRNYPNELHEAIREVMGHDGVEVRFDRSDERFYVAWFENQAKLTSNKTPTTDNDIRYSFKDSKDKYFYQLTDGQIKKLIANNTKLKVYSKTDAEGIVNNVLGSYMAFGDKYGDLRGKSKREAVEMLWRGLNSADPGKQAGVALDVAEYIMQHSAMEHLWEDAENQAYVDTIAVLKPYLHRLDLSSLKEDVKRRYDTDNSPFLIWGKRKGEIGITVDVAAQELAEQGFYIEAGNESDLFFEIDSAYRNALQAMKKQARQMLGDVLTKEQREKLKQEIAREILRGFDDTGKLSELSRVIEKYANRASVWKQKYLEEKRKNKAVNRLLYNAQKMRDLKLGTFLNASQFKSDIFKGSIERLANLKYRGDLNRGGTRKIIRGLAEWYVKDNPMLKGLFDEEVSSMLETVSKGEGDLTVDEIQTLDNIVSYFTHFVEHYNKIYRNGKYEDALPIAKKYVGILRENAPVKIGTLRNLFEKYTQTFSDPMTVARYMDRYEDGFYSHILSELREGAVNASVMEMEMRQPLEEFYKKHKAYLKDLKKRSIEYQGKKIPVQQALLLYMTLNREQALAGLAKSGFVYEDGKETIRLKGFDTTQELTVDRLKVLAQEQQKMLESQFTEADLEYVSIAEQLFNETCKEAKRKTDLLRKGYSNALEDYYVPIRRAYISHSVDTSTFADEMNRVSSASFNKDTVRGAKNELLIEPLESVLDRHIRAVSQYANLSMAIDEYDKLFNLDVGDNPNKPTSVRTESDGVWKKGDAYFKKLISDMQGIPVVKGEGTKAMGMIRSGYAKYQLGANPKVWVTQLSSFVAAGSVLDYASIVKGIGIKAGDVDKYCPLAKVRNNDNTVALAQGVLENVGKVGDILMKPIGKVDRLVIRKIFGACQVQVQKDNGFKIGTEENKIKAGQLLTKVILETQQNALSTERSAAMRSGNELVKTLTMFSSDAMKVVGRVVDAIGELSVLRHKRKNATDAEMIERLNQRIKSANKKVRKSVTSLVASAVFMALVAQLFRWLYNKDDEEETGQTIAIDAFGNLLGGLPIFKDVYARLLEGYDLDNYAYSTLNNLLDSAQNLFDIAADLVSGDTSDVARNVRNVVYSAGQLFGIPVRNIYNVGYGLTKRFSPSTAYKIDDMFYHKNYRADLNKAIEAEDEDMIATITGIMLNENIGEVESSAVRGEIDKLMQAGYNVIPRGVGKTITYDGETTTLTSAQIAEFKTIYATAHKAAESLVGLAQYKSAQAAIQAKALNFIYETYYNLAVENLLGVDLESKNVLFAEAIEIEKLAIIIATVRALTADQDKKGNAISGTRKAKVQAYVNSLKLTAAQKYMVMGYLGYSNQHGESQVKAYINRLSLSKTEKQALLKYSGYAA